MAGKSNVGRPKINDPRVKPPSYRLKLSTIMAIDELCENLKINRSELLERIIENGLGIIKSVVKT